MIRAIRHLRRELTAEERNRVLAGRAAAERNKNDLFAQARAAKAKSKRR